MSRFQRVFHHGIPINRMPLAEIIGNHRVLMENHLGICEYGDCCIVVATSLGRAIIEGEDLQIMQLDREKLVIIGKIAALRLTVGGKCE